MKLRRAMGLPAAAIPAPLFAMSLMVAPVLADQPPAVGVASQGPGATVAAAGRLSGDWGGARQRMTASGVTFNLDATADLAANASGGLRHGKGFAGLVRLGAVFDLERIAGWNGGSLHVGAFLIGGHGLGDRLSGALGPMSNIQAQPSGRLADAYLQQKLLDGKLLVRIGQIAAEGEFASAATTATFINATFDWPALNGEVLPGGGPAYPVPTPGVHVSYNFADVWTVQAGVFNGNPMGRNGQNRHGVTFPLNTGALVIGEVERRHVVGDGLPGVVKFGAWYNSGRFADLRLSANGLPLHHVDAAVHARQHRGNYAVYGLVDQTLWRALDSESSLSAFARFVAAPASRRSHVDFYADTGLAMSGLLPGRPGDVAALGVAYARISHHVRRGDEELAYFRDAPDPAHSSEVLVEASYQAQAAPWLKLQPFVQLIVRPGGGEADPARPGRRIRDAVVIGLRSHAEF